MKHDLYYSATSGPCLTYVSFRSLYKQSSLTHPSVRLIKLITRVKFHPRWAPEGATSQIFVNFLTRHIAIALRRVFVKLDVVYRG
jgi:hypothetical protein